MASPFLSRLAALAGSSRPAVVDDRRELTHSELMERARRAAAHLGPLAGRRVALLATQDADWLAAFLGVVVAGGVVVPLSPAYPPADLAWFAEDAGADVAIVSPEHAERAGAMVAGRRVMSPVELFTKAPGPLDAASASAGDGVVLFYTSGTTARPKGVMLSHANLATQAEVIRDFWGLVAEDRLLHTLPLHHVHGLGIALLNVLLAGGSVRMLPRFDASRVLDLLAEGGASVFMAVPTMYHRLRENADPDRARRAAAGLRLATSGSAALPASLAEWWAQASGTIPLERFGMTEIGVALSNPLDPAGRRVGHVGHPLPTVEIRLVDEAGVESESGPAELWVRGPSVFSGYHARPDATAAAFTEGGWFRTGDVAVRGEGGAIRLLGRTSVDILKSGGYKISALEVEEVFRAHPSVGEVAVVGVADERWGERIVAVVVPSGACDVETLRIFARERLASYKVPRDIVIESELPRNAMGKVMKPDLVKRLR